LNCMAKALDTLVLRKVMDHLGAFRITAATIWVNGDYGEHAQALVTDSQAKINNLKQWAEALEDKAIRGAYLDWINHWQRGLDDAKDELRTRQMQLKHERLNREREAREHAVREYAELHAIPEPEKE
jgi:hypothetical protein